MLGLFKSKTAEVVKTPRELMRERITTICDRYDAERDASFNSFADIYSLVCFVNDDFPSHKQTVHLSEAVAEYMFVVGHSQDPINWSERRKLVGRRENTIVFRIPADHMQSLYSDHIKMVRSGKRSQIKTVSIINHNGVVYPVAFCLGFLWGSESELYNSYPSSRI
jgi:hypothetical protein